MDLFKGIGNFLGGLFGNKKKREEQISTGQAQAPVVNTPKPVSAVEFNNPNRNKPRMLGDNFNKPLGVSVGGVVGGDKNPYETPKVQPAKPVAEVKPLTQPQKPATDSLMKGVERGGVLATFGDRRMSNGEHIYDWTNRFNKYVEDTVNREHQQWEKTRGSVDKIFNLNNFDRERSIANAKASFLADSRNTNYDNPQAVALAQKHAKAARQITDDVANNYKRTTGYGGFEGLFANSMADNAYSKMSRGIAKLNNDKSDAIHYTHLNNMLRTGQMTPEQAEQYRKNHNLSNVFGGDYILDDKTGLYRERNFLEQKRKELEDVTGLAKDSVGLFTNSARAGIDVLTGENDKKNALGHAVNFVGNLPVGMVSGLAETPEMVVNAYGQIGDGIYHGDMGESLGGVAKLGESAINVVGLGTGGSGTLLKSLGLNIGKQTTKQGAKEVAKSGVKQVFKSLGKDIGGEALEEATQSLLGQLSEHNGDMSKVDWGQIGESAVMGGLGGGVMGGLGMGVEKFNQKHHEAIDRAKPLKKSPVDGSVEIRPEALLEKTPVSSDLEKNSSSAITTGAYGSSLTENKHKINPYNSKSSYNPEELFRLENQPNRRPQLDDVDLENVYSQEKMEKLWKDRKNQIDISKINPNQWGYNLDEIIGKINGDTRKRMSERSFRKLQELKANSPYKTNDNQEVFLSNRGNKEITSTRFGTDPEFIAKMRLAPEIKNIIERSSYDHNANDSKVHGIAPDGFDYRNIKSVYGGKEYENILNIGKNNAQKRNTLYTIVTKENTSTPGFGENPSTKSYADVYDSSLAQNKHKINPYGEDFKKIRREAGRYSEDFGDTQNPYTREHPDGLNGLKNRNSTVNKIVEDTDGSRHVQIDNNIIDGLTRKPDIQKAVKNHIRDNFQGNEYQVGETGDLAKVTKKTKNEIAHQQKIMNDIDYKLKARMSGNLNELIETMSDVRTVPNYKPEQKPNVSHYISGRTTVEVDGELYNPRVDIEVNKKGDITAYDIADIKRQNKIEPRAESENRSYIREANSVLDNQGSAYGYSLAQNKHKINPYGEDFKKIRREAGRYSEDFGDTQNPYTREHPDGLNGLKNRNSTVNKIVEDENGRYVKGENLAGFDEIHNKNLPKMAKKYLEAVQDELIAETENGRIGIHKEAPGKFAYFNNGLYSKAIQDKMRMTPQIDEILEATDWLKKNGNIENVPNQIGKHPDINSWNYGKVRFEAPDPSSRQYEGIVNVGIDHNGDKSFYSVTDIKEKKRQINPNERVIEKSASNDSIVAQRGENVNSFNNENRNIGRNRERYFDGYDAPTRDRYSQIAIGDRYTDGFEGFGDRDFRVENARVNKTMEDENIKHRINDLDPKRQLEYIKVYNNEGMTSLSKLAEQSLEYGEKYPFRTLADMAGRESFGYNGAKELSDFFLAGDIELANKVCNWVKLKNDRHQKMVDLNGQRERLLRQFEEDYEVDREYNYKLGTWIGKTADPSLQKEYDGWMKELESQYDDKYWEIADYFDEQIAKAEAEIPKDLMDSEIGVNINQKLLGDTQNPYTREHPDGLNGLKNRNSTVNKIVEDENGRYVKGEMNDDFNSNNISQLQKTAKKHNNNLYKNNIPIATLEGADVFVDRDSGGKWGYFNPEMKNNKKITLDKLKMTPLQGEMIEAAQFEYTQDGSPKITPNRNKIKHPDIEYWQYGTTRFESPDNNQQYTGVVNLGFNKDYQPVYYTIDKIKELPLHPLKDVGSSRKSTNYGGSPDISSLAENKHNVNPYNENIKYKLSPEQESFFKDSKVRDESGELMRVYHGTDAEFDAFNSVDSPANKWGEGNYLAYTKEAANNYGNNLKEMYANITSPISDNQKTISFEQYDSLYRRTNDGEPAYREEYDMYDNDMDLLWDLTDKGQWQKYAQDIKEATGKDGVIMNDMAITFNPNQTKYTDNLNPTNNPDMRYKVQAQADQITAKIDELKSRHQNLTGDEDLVFNVYRNEIEKHASGYFDPKTGKINLNQLTDDVLNHEIGHKIFSRVDAEQKTSLINEVRSTFGDDALIQKYEAMYGEQTKNMSFEQKMNLFAEERLADGFSEYFNGKLNGEDGVRLGQRLGIPPKVLAYYDRMVEAIKSVFNKTDELRKFYAEIETGKYASEGQNSLNTNNAPVFKIDPERALNTLKDFKDVLYGDKNTVELTSVSPELSERIYSETGIRVNAGANYELSKPNAVHISNRHIYNKADTNPLTDIDVASLPYVLENPDVVKRGNFTRYGERIRLERRVNNDHIAVVEVIKKGNALNVVTYFNDSSSTPPNANSPVDIRPKREQSTNLVDSVAQDGDNVNNERFKMNDSTDSKPDQDIENYINQQLDAQAKDKKLSWKDRFDNFRAKFTHEMIDDAVAYEKYMDKSDKAEYSRQKAELRENIDRVRASDMIAKQFMEDNGLTKLGEMDAETMDNFQQYLIAKRHVEDLHGRDIKTGRDYATDKAIVEKFKDKFAEQEKTFRDFNHALLEYMADNDLISKEKANDLIKNNPNYAPFQRIMDDAEQFSGNSKQLGNLSSENVIKKMKGSERTVANPVESVMTNTLRVINEAERNKAAVGIAKGVFGEYRLKDGQKPRTGYDTISFFEKGKKVEYEVPVLVAQEMKNLNNATSESTKLIMKVAGAPVKALRSGATTANPIFTVSNLVRDQIQALFTGGVRSSIKGTPQALISTFGVGKKAEALRAELARNGVIGNSYRQTYGFKHGDLIKELQNEYGNAHPVVKSARKMRHPIEALADVIGKTEEFTRAQQFFGTKGDTVAKSQAAKNNTLNFSRGGSTVRILNRIVPFLNAGVQGGRTTVNTFKNRPVHSTVATAIMGGVLMAVKGQNQEKNKEVWDRLTDAEKKTNIIIAGNDAKYNPETGRVEGVIKIPLPQHLYPLADAINNTKGRSEDFLRVAGDLFSSITGVDAENPVSQLTPTAAKPFVEAAVNKNFFTGREMVSEYDKNKAPEDKGAKYTSGLARNMAKMTGIDAPIIDNFIQSWTGGLGRDLTKSFTDNPDNKKDGGGVGSYLGDGFGRRFLSGSAKSQYQIAEELANDKKKQVDAQNLSNEEKAKIKDKLDSDFKAIAKEKTKLERGEQGGGISERAGKLVNDGSLGDYIEDVLMTKAEKKRREKKTVSSSSEKTGGNGRGRGRGRKGGGKAEPNYKAMSVSTLTGLDSNLMNLLKSTRNANTSVPRLQKMQLRDFSPKTIKRGAVRFNKR